MATLDTYDETSPTGTDSVATGDDKIRELGAATKNTFDTEHDLTGRHSFLSGNTASRPAAAVAGRIYFNTEREIVERDTGAAWAMLGAVGAGFTHNEVVVAYSSTPVTIITQTVDAPAGARILVIAALSANGAAGSRVINTIEINGTEVCEQQAYTSSTTPYAALTLIGKATVAGAGTQTVTVKGSVVGSVLGNWTHKTILVMVV